MSLDHRAPKHGRFVADFTDTATLSRRENCKPFVVPELAAG
jgi:hypothetical protein